MQFSQLMILNLAQYQRCKSYMRTSLMYIWRNCCMSGGHSSLDIITYLFSFELNTLVGKPFSLSCLRMLHQQHHCVYGVLWYLAHSCYFLTSLQKSSPWIPLQLLLLVGMIKCTRGGGFVYFCTTNTQHFREDFTLCNCRNIAGCFSSPTERNNPKLFNTSFSELCVFCEGQHTT